LVAKRLLALSKGKRDGDRYKGEFVPTSIGWLTRRSSTIWITHKKTKPRCQTRSRLRARSST